MGIELRCFSVITDNCCYGTLTRNLKKNIDSFNSKREFNVIKNFWCDRLKLPIL